jgi:hypothetical protein
MSWYSTYVSLTEESRENDKKTDRRGVRCEEAEEGGKRKRRKSKGKERHTHFPSATRWSLPIFRLIYISGVGLESFKNPHSSVSGNGKLLADIPETSLRVVSLLLIPGLSSTNGLVVLTGDNKSRLERGWIISKSSPFAFIVASAKSVWEIPAGELCFFLELNEGVRDWTWCNVGESDFWESMVVVFVRGIGGGKSSRWTGGPGAVGAEWIMAGADGRRGGGTSPFLIEIGDSARFHSCRVWVDPPGEGGIWLEKDDPGDGGGILAILNPPIGGADLSPLPFPFGADLVSIESGIPGTLSFSLSFFPLPIALAIVAPKDLDLVFRG